MDQQITPHKGPSLEEVQRRFERWREGRKRGTPIPAALWEDAVRLCADHSLYKISRALHLDYNVLKKRFQPACPDHFPESVTPSDLSRVDRFLPIFRLMFVFSVYRLVSRRCHNISTMYPLAQPSLNKTSSSPLSIP